MSFNGSLEVTLGMSERKQSQDPWGAFIWLFTGASTTGLILLGQDTLVSPLLASMFVSIIPVSRASEDLKKPIAQLIFGLVSLFVALGVAGEYRISETLTILVACGAMIGMSNALSGKTMNILTLTGQIAPLAAIGYVAWHYLEIFKHDIVQAFFLACGFCFAGGVVGRLTR